MLVTAKAPLAQPTGEAIYYQLSFQKPALVFVPSLSVSKLDHQDGTFINGRRSGRQELVLNPRLNLVITIWAHGYEEVVLLHAATAILMGQLLIQESTSTQCWLNVSNQLLWSRGPDTISTTGSVIMYNRLLSSRSRNILPARLIGEAFLPAFVALAA